MPVFESYPAGTPCWIDLMSPDVDASKSFYQSVFGWDAEDNFDDEGNRIYTQFKQGDHIVAGLGGQAPGMEGMPAFWNTYIASDDVAATAAAVTEAGGTVMMPPMQVMDAGHMAIFADPTGAAFSVWQANEHRGAGIANEPNTWSWNELMSRDIDTAKDFYSAVFGWEYEAMDMGPGGTYHVIKGGEHNGLGGLMAMPPT
ncbi:MAG: VOC family protein, partial [Acidimicrobiia bacterium]|nr:VOC family protein [Acidimicrobiia bacterium]